LKKLRLDPATAGEHFVLIGQGKAGPCAVGITEKGERKHLDGLNSSNPLTFVGASLVLYLPGPILKSKRNIMKH
jgi:hypothetical protein